MTTITSLRICFAVAVFVLLACTGSNAQTKKVRKEVQMEYMVDSLGNLVPDTTEFTKLYDRNGNVTEETQKSIWPLLKKVVLYIKKNFYTHRSQYDSTVTSIDGKPGMTLRVRHDSSGRESEVQEFTPESKPGYRTRNIYAGKSKRKLKVEMYDPDNKLFNFKNYRYDARGSLMEEAGSESGEPRYRWLYRYDADNRLVERDDYSGSGDLMRRNLYAYNADKRISQVSIVNARGQLERVVKYSYEYY